MSVNVMLTEVQIVTSVSIVKHLWSKALYNFAVQFTLHCNSWHFTSTSLHQKYKQNFCLCVHSFVVPTFSTTA